MKLEPRTIKGSKMRSKDLTPGVLYGKGIKSVPVQANATEFHKMYNAKGTSKTFEVTLEKKKHIVYIKEAQPSYGNTHTKIHFDLVKVSKDDTMTSKINVVFLNHAEVEKRGLIVSAVMPQIEVEYAVGSGISHVDLDVKGLDENDTLLVKDIVIPDGVTVLEDLESVVVSISAQKEEVEPTEEEGIITEVTSIKQSDE